MDDEVRRLERLAAHDPAHRAALQLALRRAGLPPRDVAGILEEAARLNAELSVTRDAWLGDLARGWPALLDALFREEPALDLLVVTAHMEERYDRPWSVLVHVAVDGATLVELLGVDEVLGPGVRAHPAEAAWRVNRLDEAARRRIAGAALAFAPHFAVEVGRQATRVVARRGADGAPRAETRELERWVDGVVPAAVREVIDALDDDALRGQALDELGARDVPLEALHVAHAAAAAPAATVDELVARARAATAARDAARDDALVALGDAFERLVPALLDEHPTLPGFAVHGFTPSFMDGDLCEHTQYVLSSERELTDAAVELAQAGLPELGLRALAARAPREHVQRLRDAVAPFAAALQALHGFCWVLVVERLDDGRVTARVGRGFRPY